MPRNDQKPGVHLSGRNKIHNNNNELTDSNSNSKDKASLRRGWNKMKVNDERGRQLTAGKSNAIKNEK